MVLTAKFSEEENEPVLRFSNVELASLKEYMGLILVQGRLQIISRLYEFDSSCLEGGQLLIFSCGLTSMERLLFSSVLFQLNTEHLSQDYCLMWQQTSADLRAQQLLQERRSDNYNQYVDACTKLLQLINFFNKSKHCSNGYNNRVCIHIHIYIKWFVFGMWFERKINSYSWRKNVVIYLKDLNLSLIIHVFSSSVWP